MRGSWRPNRTAIYWRPLLWPRQRCVFLVLQGCSTGGPGAQLSDGWWLSLLHLISNFFGPQLNRRPRGPLRPGVAFPTTSRLYNSNSPGASVAFPTTTNQQLISNSWLLVLTELYNSSTHTQSPTRSLEWHIWSSSSGNSCHAVQRSLSSGASVYECTMGILACPILLANFRPPDFLL